MERYKQNPQDTLNRNTYKGTQNEEFVKFFADYSAPFSALQVGITYPDENYFISRKNTSAFVLEYVVSGKGFVEVEGKRESLSAGDVYLLQPGKDHCYGADKDNPYKKIWINFNSKMFVNVVESFGLDKVV